MTASDLVRVLQWMKPTIEEIAETLFWGDLAPTRLDGPVDRSYQRDANRRFIVANLLDDVGITEWQPSDLPPIARAWAALLRDALARDYPNRTHVVEIVGLAGVEHEPLELCVTFCEIG